MVFTTVVAKRLSGKVFLFLPRFNLFKSISLDRFASPGNDRESSLKAKHLCRVCARKRRNAGMQIHITPTFSSTFDHIPLANVSYVGFKVFEYFVKVCTRRHDMVITLAMSAGPVIEHNIHAGTTYTKPTPNTADKSSFFLIVRLSLHSCGIGMSAITMSELIFAAAAK